MELVFEVPGPDAAGYLRRQRRVLEFRRAEKDAPESIDALVEFLADYVSVPEDREEAKEALMEASENQIDELLEAISGTGKVDPKKEGDSESG